MSLDAEQAYKAENLLHGLWNLKQLMTKYVLGVIRLKAYMS